MVTFTSSPSPVSLPEVCLAVAKGVRQHVSQCANMDYSADALESFQVAMQILHILLPDMVWTGKTARAFADLCGLPDVDVADGYCIY